MSRTDVSVAEYGMNQEIEKLKAELANSTKQNHGVIAKRIMRLRFILAELEYIKNTSDVQEEIH